MAHWIIEDHGFGGSYYMCSNCKNVWNDIYNDVLSEDFCPECGEPINKDETTYTVPLKKPKADNTIIFPQTIGDITYYSKEELFEWVENQQKINKKRTATIPSGSVLTKEQTDTLYKFAKFLTPISADEWKKLGYTEEDYKKYLSTIA